ncbi:hypothetical protein CR513_49734, partial [Mucuna pruriens]
MASWIRKHLMTTSHLHHHPWNLNHCQVISSTPTWTLNNDFHVLRQHKKEIGWKLLDLPSINISICMHKILMDEEAKPIRQQ